MQMFDGIEFAQKVPRGILVAAAVVVLLSLSVLAVWANDVRKDREHAVAVISSTPVFVGNGSEGDCYTQPVKAAVEQAGTSLRVRRIRYWKDCATVNVVLPDGRSGDIILGVGDVSMRPALDR
jgi:hypothetical protein